MATHSSVLAWRIPGMGEPGGLACEAGETWNARGGCSLHEAVAVCSLVSHLVAADTSFPTGLPYFHQSIQLRGVEQLKPELLNVHSAVLRGHSTVTVRAVSRTAWTLQPGLLCSWAVPLLGCGIAACLGLFSIFCSPGRGALSHPCLAPPRVSWEKHLLKYRPSDC